MPWMPFYTGAQDNMPATERIENFAEKLPQIARQLNIAPCPMLACILATDYAFAALSRHPDYFTGLVLAGMALPLTEIDDRAAMTPAWRAPLELGTRFPRFFELFARVIFRLALRGEVHHYFDKLFKHSPRDRQTLRDPDIARTMRRGAENRPDRFGAAMAHGFAVMTIDWSPWLENLDRPVRLTFGAEDVVSLPEQLAQFAEKRGLTAVGPLEGVAGFFCFRHRKLCLRSSSNSRLGA